MPEADLGYWPSLNGLESLRAYEYQTTFMQQHVLDLDTNHRAFFLSNGANRWLSMRLELVGGTLTLMTSLLLILTRTKEEAAIAGENQQIAFVQNFC